MILFYLSLIEAEEDRVIFSKIYEKHLDWMLQIAYHYTKNEHDAQDVVHDVFMDIIKTDSSIPVNSCDETKAYLFICLRNRASTFNKIKNKLLTISLDKLHNLSTEDAVEKDSSVLSTANQLQAFIDTMPAIYKDVLFLYFVKHKSLKDISKILKAPLNTAATRLKRGKAILKERFKDLNI